MSSPSKRPPVNPQAGSGNIAYAQPNQYAQQSNPAGGYSVVQSHALPPTYSQQSFPQSHPQQPRPPLPQVHYQQAGPSSQNFNNPPHPSQVDGLQFYQGTYSSFSGNERSTSLGVAPSVSPYQGMISAGVHQGAHIYTNINQQQPVSFLAAFGTGGLPTDPPLLDELGINLSHIRAKTVAVLNPIQPVDRHIMDDTDLAGPLLFCLLFGTSLLLAGKVHFGYIYGVALLGWASLYGLLNAMAERDNSIDTLRTASVLGYCLLPMVLLSLISLFLPLRGILGLILGSLTVLWCSISSSNMFVSALSMREQRILVAYPVGLFYFCFALMTIF